MSTKLGTRLNCGLHDEAPLNITAYLPPITDRSAYITLFLTGVTSPEILGSFGPPLTAEPGRLFRSKLDRNGGPVSRRSKVELFEEIRREYEFGAGTIQGAARKLGVHRRMVRQALADAIPPPRTGKEKPATKPTS